MDGCLVNMYIFVYLYMYMYTHTTQLQDTTIFFCGGVQNKLFLIDTKQDGAIMTFDGLRPMPTHSLSVVPDSSPGIYVYMRMCWYMCMYMHETPPTHSRSVVPDSSARAYTHTHKQPTAKGQRRQRRARRRPEHRAGGEEVSSLGALWAGWCAGVLPLLPAPVRMRARRCAVTMSGLRRRQGRGARA